jgi:hypothetical protein
LAGRVLCDGRTRPVRNGSRDCIRPNSSVGWSLFAGCVRGLAVAYASRMPIPRFLKDRVAKEEAVLIGDPRVEGWESVSTFEDQQTAVAWRDQLRSMGVDASCVADHPLDPFGRGDIYLMVPPEQWSRASEIVDNLE